MGHLFRNDFLGAKGPLTILFLQDAAGQRMILGPFNPLVVAQQQAVLSQLEQCFLEGHRDGGQAHWNHHFRTPGQGQAIRCQRGASHLAGFLHAIHHLVLACSLHPLVTPIVDPELIACLQCAIFQLDHLTELGITGAPSFTAACHHLGVGQRRHAFLALDVNQPSVTQLDEDPLHWHISGQLLEMIPCLQGILWSLTWSG
mmetsp:Transcript_80566/g.127240  ORF Transcript_80566/g.127240 Transcript_80566/m.127240 type:complete len:201 (+) Transcript_80566:667-1269(+)